MRFVMISRDKCQLCYHNIEHELATKVAWGAERCIYVGSWNRSYGFDQACGGRNT